MSTRAKSVYFVRTALGSMVRSPFVHVIAIASLALALVGYGLARLASGQLDALVASLGGQVEFTVYLAPDAPEDKVKELEAALTQRTGGAVHRVSPAQALGRLVEELGDQGKALEGMNDNPLPWSLEVAVPAAAREGGQLEALAEKVRGLSFVTGVDYGQEALARLAMISRALKLAGLVAFALVFLTTVIIVSATLQLAIFSRREEIEIQKLVGGTDRFVRMPFLIEGAVQGAVAALVSFGLVFALARYVESSHGDAVAFLRLGGQVAADWPRLGAEQLGLGVGLGLLGSFVAVRRFLKV
ncbi:MAG: ABC transporter permease [Myxococcales bacterium]|nr:ABC transporter permease [Myxococcales bacterium]